MDGPPTCPAPKPTGDAHWPKLTLARGERVGVPKPKPRADGLAALGKARAEGGCWVMEFAILAGGNMDLSEEGMVQGDCCCVKQQ